MGCWNETCGFNQETISAGTPCYAVIIINNSHIESSCYSNGIASPSSFVIEGDYNDYGSLENLKENFASKATLHLFNKLFKNGNLIIDGAESYIESTQYNDNNINFEKEDGFKNIEYLLLLIERGAISIKQSGYRGQSVNTVNFMLFKKDTIDLAIKAVNNIDDCDYRDSSWTVVKDDVITLLDTLTPLDGEAPKILSKEEIREALKVPGISDLEEDRLYDLLLSMDSGKSWGGDNLGSNHSDWGNKCRVLNNYDSVNTQSFGELYRYLKETYDSTNRDDIIEAVSLFIMLNTTFQAFRKSWSPQGHKNQYDSFNLDIIFTEAHLRLLYKERQDRYDDGWYDDSGIPSVIGAISIFDEGKIKCDS